MRRSRSKLAGNAIGRNESKLGITEADERLIVCEKRDRSLVGG